LVMSAEELEFIARIEGVSVKPIELLEGGLPLYDSAVQLWPAGDPDVLLGVGTWDPFLNVENDLVAEFERVPPPRRSEKIAQPAKASYSALTLDREFTSLRWLRRLFTCGVYAFGAAGLLLILIVVGAFIIEFLR